MRDRSGIRPGVVGLKDGKYVFTSEDIAIRKNGGIFVEDIEPGFVYNLYPNGRFAKSKIVEPRISHCFFEWNYLGDFESIINGIPVATVRRNLGIRCAKEIPELNYVDFITYLPRSPEAAARAASSFLGKPFVHVFYKKMAERSFIGSTARDRRESIKNNLYLMPDIRENDGSFLDELKMPLKPSSETPFSLKNSFPAVFDDSEIRGNNVKRERYLLFEEGGVRDAIHVNYTPRVGIIGDDGVKRGCPYGVDMPPEDNFVARTRDGKRNRSPAEISRVTRIKTRFISTEGMLQEFENSGISRNKLCTNCIGGCDPYKGKC